MGTAAMLPEEVMVPWPEEHQSSATGRLSPGDEFNQAGSLS
jgi:hypothetical protein